MRVNDDLATLFQRLRTGDRRALSRALTHIENGHPQATGLVDAVNRPADAARRVGITGPPGAGKSTLVAAMVGAHRAAGRSVAVLAVDPSSPDGRGAILGDRTRMSRHYLDPGVFIRSMGTRGALGGLSDAAGEALVLLNAAGFDEVIVETVGTGQVELDVTGHAGTVVLTLMPGGGDSVQAMKSGIIEVADIIVVNKGDLEGAKQLVNEVRQALTLRRPADWKIPVVRTDALTGEGIDDLLTAIQAHRDYLRSRPGTPVLRRQMLANQIVAQAVALLRVEARRLLDSPAGDALIQDLQHGALSPRAAAEQLAGMVANTPQPQEA
jgi:LAO/AO transport system kinase